jgi:putative spermidine/putrescine transport system substrate-binding protein
MKLTRLVWFGALSAALSSTLLSGSAVWAADVTLKIASYGGAFDQVEKRAAADPFTKLTGIKIEFIDASPTTHLAKMIAAKGHTPPYDLVILDGDVRGQAQAAGVLAKLDPAAVKNLSEIYPQMRNPAGYGPSFMLLSIGIAYNPEKFKAAGIPEPTSWADLWNPKLAGHVSVPSLENVMGRNFLVAAARLAGGSDAPLSAGITKISTLKAESYYVSSTELEPKFSSGDVWAAPWINQRAWGMAQKGAPIRFVLPKEGGYADVGTIDMVANTPHRTEAQRFIDYQLSTQPELIWATTFLAGPANPAATAQLSNQPEVLAKFPSSPEQLSKLNNVNWESFWPQYPGLLDQWNRMLVSR